jgi:hypothetical protein
MSNCFDRAEQAMINALTELSAAIAEGDRRCATAAVMRRVRRATRWADEARAALSQIRSATDGVAVRDNLQEALRFGRTL